MGAFSTINANGALKTAILVRTRLWNLILAVSSKGGIAMGLECSIECNKLTAPKGLRAERLSHIHRPKVKLLMTCNEFTLISKDTNRQLSTETFTAEKLSRLK